MNLLNYGSLEACKRLVDNGIVLETEKAWFFITTGWEMVDRYAAHHVNRHYLPAPSMAEVWGELPPQGCYLTANQGYYHAWIVWTGFEGYEKSYDVKEYTNPTDALISLLIWVRKENNAS